jgi:tetratricopeptide (TPR) repeat protein
LQSHLWTQWTPYENPDPSILTDAAQLMFTRYNSHGSVQDLDDIIALHRRVLDTTSLHGVRHFVSLNDLAEALCERWYQRTQMNDIEESISLFEEALGLCARRDEHRAIILGNFAQALIYLNLHCTEGRRYSSAVSLLRKALSITPLQNDVLTVLKTRLCTALNGYYAYSEGTINDLQEAIGVCRNAVSLLPVGHRYRPEALHSLAAALGRMDDKEPGTETPDYGAELRLLYWWALNAQSFTHPRRARCLSSLGICLVFAYLKKQGSKSDLNEGIRLMQEAMPLITSSHITYPSVLGNLAHGLTMRFSHLQQNREDLDSSIKLQEEAMNARASSSGKRYNNVHNLAVALVNRYKHFDDPEDLHRAISLGREALASCPPGHPDHAYSVSALSQRLILDPNCLITDINEMIGLSKAIIEDEYKPGANRPGKSIYLYIIASLLHARFLRSRDPNDRAQFAELFEAAVQDQSSSFETRFSIAKRWISVAESLDAPDMAIKAYRIAIHVSPYSLYPGLDLTSQLDVLKRDFATLSCDAACCALAIADASEALTLLEQGRATFWAQRLQLRISFDALPSDLAGRLIGATEKLQEYHSRKRVQNASGEQHLMEQHSHYETFQRLMREARLYPTFTDSLRPIQFEQLAELVENGPLIVLLSSKIHGSFALILQNRSPTVEKLPLFSITTDDLQAMVEGLQTSVSWARQEMRDTADEGHGRLKIDKGKPGPLKKIPDAMTKLWSTVGKPIMRHLSIEVSTQ